MDNNNKKHKEKITKPTIILMLIGILVLVLGIAVFQFGRINKQDSLMRSSQYLSLKNTVSAQKKQLIQLTGKSSNSDSNKVKNQSNQEQEKVQKIVQKAKVQADKVVKYQTTISNELIKNNMETENNETLAKAQGDFKSLTDVSQLSRYVTLNWFAPTDGQTLTSVVGAANSKSVVHIMWLVKDKDGKTLRIIQAQYDGDSGLFSRFTTLIQPDALNVEQQVKASQEGDQDEN